MRPSILAGVLTVFLVAACATPPGQQNFLESQRLIKEGKIEDGLRYLQKAADEDPKNYRSTYFRERELRLGQLLADADTLRGLLQFDAADAAYRRVLTVDANNVRAKAGLEGIQIDRKYRILIAEAETLFAADKLDAAAAKLRLVLAENPNHPEAKILQRRIDERAARVANPALKAAMGGTISLEFRDANLKSVFEVISRHASINFVFDKDLRPDLKTTIVVRNSTVESVINMLLMSNQLRNKVINDNTILIYPNTPAKVREHQELSIKSFYLTNADVKQTLTMIRAILKTRDIFIDEKLNLLVMRDTPEAIRLAEKLIAAQDLAEPEVVLEVEVLEIKRTRLQELGIQYPTQFTILNIVPNPTTVVATATGPVATTNATTTTTQLTVDTLRNLRGSSIGVTPNPSLNVRKDESDTNILANPRIRVKNREKARIHIGDRVPVITTTSTANVGVSESVTFLDVGIKLEVESNVYLENDVGIKVGLEVSNIVNTVTSKSGTLTYQVGTRSAATILRLKDGETQALAGLINDEDRKSASKVPGLGDLPLIGRLFSNNRNEGTKTEIVLLITPRIVRNLIQPSAATTEFTSGTESAASSLGAPLDLGQGAVVTPPPQAPKPPAGASPAAPAAKPTEPAGSLGITTPSTPIQVPSPVLPAQKP
jgi:general secretion pathway protein D